MQGSSDVLRNVCMCLDYPEDRPVYAACLVTKVLLASDSITTTPASVLSLLTWLLVIRTSRSGMLIIGPLSTACISFAEKLLRVMSTCLYRFIYVSLYPEFFVAAPLFGYPTQTIALIWIMLRFAHTLKTMR